MGCVSNSNALTVVGYLLELSPLPHLQMTMRKEYTNTTMKNNTHWLFCHQLEFENFFYDVLTEYFRPNFSNQVANRESFMEELRNH